MKSKKTISRKGKEKVKTSGDVLTKTFLEKAARKGVQEATSTTIKVMGFNVVARNGWIVKEFPDNKIERISRIPALKASK